MTDGELLQLLAQDDTAAFNTLFYRHWDPLYRTAVARTGEAQVAFDLIQDVFVELWQKRQGLDIRESLPQYLAGILRYKIFNHFRNSKRRNQQLQQLTQMLDALEEREHQAVNVREEWEKELAWERAVD